MGKFVEDMKLERIRKLGVQSIFISWKHDLNLRILNSCRGRRLDPKSQITAQAEIW